MNAFSTRTVPRSPMILKVPYMLLLILALALTFPVAAQSPTRTVTDDEVNAIAKELYCPVCESTPLDVCPTQACADWREVIRTKLSQGQGEEEIKAYFETQYGARALAEPPVQGFTMAVWILPILAVVVGAIVFGRYLRGIRSATETGSASPPEPTPSPVEPVPKDDYEARIERELRENRP